MRTETTTKTYYQFNELSDEAKQKALECLNDLNVDHDWWDFVYDDAKEIGKLLGIDIEDIYFSGFWSQGDGAQFVGSYCYERESVKKVRAYAPKDAELHEIAQGLYEVQRRHFYKLQARVDHYGHYHHEMSTDIDVLYGDVVLPSNDGVTEDVTDCLRDFMRWIYRRLKEEYYYLTSEEAIIESIEANEYEFDEQGNFPPCSC